MIDILIQEQGSGGDMLVRNNDIVTVAGFENMPYMQQFGGDAWFGNGLLVEGSQIYSSETEKALVSVPLTSAGRTIIEQAMNNDLEPLTELAAGTTVAVSTTIASKNRLNAAISFAGNTFYINWNPDPSFLNYQLK